MTVTDPTFALPDCEYKDCFDLGRSLLCVLSRDGRFVRVNPVWRDVLGYEAPEPEGCLLLDMVHPDDAEDTGRMFRVLSERGAVCRFTNRFRHSDGSWRRLEWQARRRGDRVCAVAHDVSEAHSVRQRMEHVTSLVMMLLEQSSSLLAAEGVTEDVIRETMGRIGTHLGVDRVYIFRLDDTRGTMSNTHEWCAPEIPSTRAMLQDLEQDMFPAWMSRLRAGEEILIPRVADLPDTWASEREILRQQQVASVLALPIVSGDRLYGFMGFDALRESFSWGAESYGVLRFFANNVASVWAHEQTHRELNNAMETTRRLAKEADEASREKTAFLSTLSHEIRSPMNAVIGMTNLLRDTELTGKQRRYCDIIAGSSDNLIQVINHVLDIAHIESGQLRIETQTFSLPRVLESVRQMYLYAAGEKNLALTLTVSPALERPLSGDPTRIRQIVTNLVSNAVKYAEAGTVSIEAEPETGGQMRIRVRDEGPGIAAEELPRIFEPFWRSDRARAGHTGSGLGLAICRQLSSAMNGSLEADSTPGTGSVFTLRLPLAYGENLEAADAAGYDEAATPARDTLRDTVRSVNVLVAEDIDTNREIVQAYLASAGVVSDAVDNGTEAVRRVREGAYDVVLMDVRMPGMDGMDATRAIRALPDVRRADIPVIALTAHAFEEDRQRCLEAGMNDCVTKPIQPDEFYRVLARWLPRKEHAPDAPEQGNGSEAEAASGGFSADAGIQAAAGSSELHRKLLHRLLDDYADTDDRVQEDLRQGRAGDLADRLHRLRSLSGLLGDTAFTQLTGELEGELRNGGLPLTPETAARMTRWLDMWRSLTRAAQRHLSR